MKRLLVATLLAEVLHGQTAVLDSKDVLGRGTPQSSILYFLEACHSREYQKAVYYLDLRRKQGDRRAKEGPDLARQLEDLLDDTSFDIATLSHSPEGDQFDGLSSALEHLATFQVDGQEVELQLERVNLKGNLNVWLVSSDSVELIPRAHKIVGESPFEKRLPQPLVTFEVLDTPVWRWIALGLMAAALWWIADLLSWALIKVNRWLVDDPALRDPLRASLALLGFRAALELAPPSALPRMFLERAVGLGLALTVAWAAAVVIDLFSRRWYARLDPRMQAVSYSMLPLGRQITKLCLFLFAILAVVGAWGYNTSAILAGLGVGGLAVALAAQKTIENLFGGISVIGDRPVLVGDVCRFGEHTGTITHIGLRSTRLRTAERTILSIPNAQFSSMALENISGRDKISFHPTINLRRSTTSDQLLQVLSSFRQLLEENPKVETGKTPVRFVGVGTYSLDIEIGVYVKTSDYDEFLALQQELLIRMLQAVEHAGAALAVPVQERLSASPQMQPA